MATSRILIVDDDELLASLYRGLLQRHGFEALAVTDSLKALELFEESPDAFDLIITDHMMPNLTGFELARKMLRIRPDLPIILATGFSQMVTREEALALGIREYLMKPFPTKRLIEAIRAILNGE